MHVHHETALIYCKRKLIPAKKVGGKWQVYRDELLKAPTIPAEAVAVKRRRGRPRKKAA